ncbi:MAG: PilW family protein [Azovibrio sp.]
MNNKMADYSPGFKERGVSLVETMVALAIGLLIIVAIYSVFFKSREGGVLSADMARIQEGGRVAMDMIASDLRMASFAGCGKMALDSATSPLIKVGADTLIDYTTYQQGVWVRRYDPVQTKFVIEGSLVGRANTDVLRILGVSTESATLAAAMAPGTKKIQLSAGNSLGTVSGNDLLLIASCGTDFPPPTDLFKATGVSGATFESTTPLTINYGTDAVVYRYVDVSYYLRDAADPSGNPRLDSAGNRIASLFRADSQGSVELVESVDAFRVCLGVDSDENGTVDRYVTAAAPGSVDWGRVISVQVDMLVSSVTTNILPEAQLQEFSLCLDAMPSFQVTDRKFRKLFSTSVALRNKVREG